MLVVIWWLFWSIAAYVDKNLDISEVTIGIIVSSIIFFVFGWSILENISSQIKFKGNYLYINFNLIIYTILFIQLIMVVLSLRYSMANPGAIRDIAYSNPEEIYLNLYTLQLYSLLIYPIGLFSIISLNFFDVTARRKILIILFFLSDTLITLGRLSVYYLFIYLLIAYIASDKKINRKIIIINFFIANILMYLLFNYRYANELNISFDNYFSYFKNSVFNYHIIGIKIFDNFINNYFRFESNTFLTFGFLEYISSKFNSIFSPTISDYAKYGEVLQGFVIDFEGGKYNAFSTIFLPYYLDFGFIGPSAVLLIFGSIVGLSCGKGGDINPLGMMVIFLIMIGLLQSITIGPYFYIPLALTILRLKIV